ncbi:MAG: hypothetical protein CL943_03240 [Candidatus Diapherotrites archaeon]|uniref:Uncharacterized protein n=1 Tax=Candidatus Iainarchaeum sp. TaxID=3101447 RepID=A0A2D6M1J2_9ARCH|nr:hypothetical protein [Candidatus Diapherotrites archaeon]|tara:strand:- start:586 stop:1446 length:861 start_codon:yes stop_codon:yes gene_type:complete
MTITVPELGAGKKDSTKDLIIRVLSESWPLSVKEIYVRISQHGKNISYQAVHKVLNELVEEKILSHSGKTFQLNSEWVRSSKSFFHNLEKKLSGKALEDLKYLKPRESIIFNFNNLTNFALFIAQAYADKVMITDGDTKAIGIFHHLFWTPRFRFEDILLSRKVIDSSLSGYVLSGGNSPFDQWVKKQYLAAGFNGVKLGVDLSDFEDDLFVHGDFVAQVHISEEDRKKIKELYNSVGTVLDLFKLYITKFGKPDTIRIKATFSRNPVMAKMVRNHVLKFFEEDVK